MRLKSWFAVLLLGCCTSALAAELRLYTEEYRPLSYFENGKLTGQVADPILGKQAKVDALRAFAHAPSTPFRSGASVNRSIARTWRYF